MNHNNKLQCFLAGAFLLLSSTTHAIPTSEVTFESGSGCGTYSGDLTSGRLFIIELSANQALKVSTDGHIQSVTDSKNQQLSDLGGYDYRYLAKNSGTHTIKMVGRSTSEVSFCIN